jgi:1A family penicillin-binding protein
MFSRTARRRLKKLLLWVEILFILGMGAGVGVVAGAFYQMSRLLPPDSEIHDYKPVAGTKFYSSDGVYLGSIADENREPVEIKRIPKRMQDAIIAIEDSRFYEHSGLDFRGLIRALWKNISSGDLNQQGGSTLTQQLARQIYLTPKKTMARKMKEAMLAIQIERNWSKKQILETYLNQVYFGGRAYGVQAASQTYFGKNVWQLNLPECALLAGLPQRPSKLNPYDNPEAARIRRNLVLSRMAELGMIAEAESEKAQRQPIRLAHKRAPAGTGFKRAPYFCNAVLDQLRENYGDPLLHKGGFKVFTTLNWKMQQLAEQALVEGINGNRRRYNVHEGALVCLDPNTGYVRAMVGGLDFWRNQFNVVTQGRRQPGSSFKAFVYTAAIDTQGWGPWQAIDASSRSYLVGDKWYSPHNDDGRHFGRIELAKAFASSINTAAVNTIHRIGPRTVVEYARRFGIKSRLYAYDSLALGTSEVSPMEMANAYGVFATNGIRAEPILVRLIKDRMGNVIEDNSPALHRVDVKPETIQAMNELFQAVVQFGTAARSGASEVPTAHGKTGTTERHTDAWFIGYTLQPALVTAVWAGNRDNTPMRHAFGGSVCAPIWAHYMKDAVKIAPKTSLGIGEPLASGNLKARQRDERSGEDQGDAEARKPRHRRHDGEEEASATDGTPSLATAQPASGYGDSGSMVRVRVCEETYELASPSCPHVRTLEYISGQQPRRFCSLHGLVHARHHTRRRHRRREAAPDQPVTAAESGRATATAGPTPAVPVDHSASASGSGDDQ